MDDRDFELPLEGSLGQFALIYTNNNLPDSLSKDEDAADRDTALKEENPKEHTDKKKRTIRSR